MIRRTTGLAGTFALMFVAHGVMAQRESRPRIGMVIPARQGPVVPSRLATGTVQTAWIGSRAGSGWRGGVTYQPPRAAPAQAQVTGIQYASGGSYVVRGSSSAKPRIGLVVPGPPLSQGQFPPTVFGQTHDMGFVQVAQFFYLPAVVLTDGRVFANFNGSYEQVLRRCPAISGPAVPGFATTACWMIDAYGRYVVAQPG